MQSEEKAMIHPRNEAPNRRATKATGERKTPKTTFTLV
jgi:hypothetical protein